MHYPRRNELLTLFLVSLVALLGLLSVPWYQHLPPRAESADQLWVGVFSRERGDIEAELGTRDSRFLALDAATARWAEVKQSMVQQGATPQEAERISLCAQEQCPIDKNGDFLPDWPIFIRRGYVKEKPVWVSVCAAPSQKPQEAEIVTGWDYYVRVIDPQNPNNINGLYSSNGSFPRCGGPNTPFPVH